MQGSVFDFPEITIQLEWHEAWGSLGNNSQHIISHSNQRDRQHKFVNAEEGKTVYIVAGKPSLMEHGSSRWTRTGDESLKRGSTG